MGRPFHREDGPSVSAIVLGMFDFKFAHFFLIFNPRMHDFNQSLSYDKRMHVQDINGSIAYAKALSLSGILTKEEVNTIVKGLEQVRAEWTSGQASTLCLSI